MSERHYASTRNAVEITRKYGWPATKGAIKIGAAGFAIGTARIGGLTIRSHKGGHGSVETSPGFGKLLRASEYSIGVKARNWIDTHWLHHGEVDGNLYPAYKIAEFMHYRETHPEDEIAQSAVLPETIPHLDPGVEQMPFEVVLKAGNYGRNKVIKRIGEDKYVVRDTPYTEAEINGLLYPTEPQYEYGPNDKKKKEYTQDDKALRLLRDPHSPILAPTVTDRKGRKRKNGVRYVWRNNVTLYKDPTNMFKNEPELGDPRIETNDDENPNYLPYVVGGFLVTSAAVLLARRKFKPKDFAIAAVAGSAIHGIAVAEEVNGGRVTNADGHKGKGKSIRALFRRNYELEPHDNGSYATNTNDNGLAGRAEGVATLGEVAGQKAHHEGPWKRIFTWREGLQAAVDDPWGYSIDKLAKAKWFPWIKEGKGLPIKEGERRPDMPSEGIELYMKEREAQIARKKAEALKQAA